MAELAQAELSRRAFSRQTLGSLLTFSLLESLAGGDAWGEEIRPIAARWVEDVNQLGQDLKGEKIDQAQWQAKVEELLGKVELAELLAYIEFDKLTRDLKFAEKGARSLQPRFSAVQGLPTELVFGRQIFALKKDRSVIPHGHNNMATAFLILQGEFQGRHYDRLEDEKEHLIIRPTIDRTFGPAECSTVTDHKDNIHWFKASSETGFIFNIHLLDVTPGSKRRTGRVYLDPAGEPLSGGRIRARRISADEAHKLYG